MQQKFAQQVELCTKIIVISKTATVTYLWYEGYFVAMLPSAELKESSSDLYTKLSSSCNTQSTSQYIHEDCAVSYYTAQ